VREATVAISNLGCKANQYDGTYMRALLKRHNFRLVDFKEAADIYIINTCTVTDHADLDSRNIIRRAHRRNPDAIKIVTGCYAQTRPEEVARVEGVNVVLGNNGKAGLLDCIERARREREKVHVEVDDIFRRTELETFGMAADTENTRAYVKIQDGCNRFCSFCIIPYARGLSRSISIPRILDELFRLSENGFHEAVLTGIHIGTYGQDLSPAVSLTELLKAIEQARPIHRVRVSSIDPEEVTEEMIEIFSGSKVLCPHLHIPLQSGDDASLQMMRRRYTAKHFAELCEKLMSEISDVCLGTDVIVGFPYENEERAENTYRLLKDGPVSYFHVFPFSPKRGTRAAKMLGQVPYPIKKDRAERLRLLSRKKSRNYRRGFLNREVEVILERLDDSWQNEPATDGEWWNGVSANYLPVSVKTFNGARGRLLRCRLEKEREGKLAGSHYQG
jgi:threonylcarbamoyladenosine tRNA methylthiotransferase MtaB